MLLIDASNGSFVHDYGPALVATVGLVLNGLILLKAALVASGRRDADIEAIQKWTDNHEEDAKQRDQQISQLKELASASKEMAKGQERRLQMLEDRREDGTSETRRKR